LESSEYSLLKSENTCNVCVMYVNVRISCINCETILIFSGKYCTISKFYIVYWGRVCWFAHAWNVTTILKRVPYSAGGNLTEHCSKPGVLWPFENHWGRSTQINIFPKDVGKSTSESTMKIYCQEDVNRHFSWF
jgi:hypothetical protein